MKSDEIIEHIGAFGKYQRIQLLLAGLPNILCSFHFIILVFHSITPDFRCKLPNYPNDTYDIQSSSHNASFISLIPQTKDAEVDSCHVYKQNGSNITNTLLECSEHVFNRNEYNGNTVSTQFELVCSRKSLNTVSKLVFTVGLVIGAAVIGIVADWIGRKKAIVCALFVGNSFSLAAMFSVNVIMYMVMRFGLGFCLVGILAVAHVLCVEVVGPSKRPLAVALKNCFWPTGVMLLSLCAFLLKDWNYLQLSITIPGFLITLLAAIFMRESPKWLISKGRHEEAIKLFEEIARVNGRELPSKLEQTIAEVEEGASKERLVSIFKARTLLIRVLIMFFLWFTASFGYYGLTLGVGYLVGDIYINNLISGLVEFPSVAIVYLSRWVGRKKIFLFFMFLGSLSLITSAVLTAYLDLNAFGAVIISISMIGKASVKVIFALNYLWSSELFPTTLRTSLVGTCSLMARIGTMLAPVVADLHTYVTTIFGKGIGPLIFGVVMFVGGVVTFVLPETNNLTVPENIQEANSFSTNRKGKVQIEETDKKLSDGDKEKDTTNL